MCKSTDDFHTYNNQGKPDMWGEFDEEDKHAESGIADKSLDPDVAHDTAILVDKVHNYTNTDTVYIEYNVDNVREHFFVFEYATNMVVWHISDITDNQINKYNEAHVLPSQDKSYIIPTAAHFWTFKACTAFLDEMVEMYENIGETSDITFL